MILVASAFVLVGGPLAHAGELTYAHVWASAPPEPFRSAGLRMIERGEAIVVFVPRAQLVANIGEYRSSNGWVRSAYARADLSPCIIVIANDVPAAAIANLREHEAAHCVRSSGAWDNDHAGALKPAGHLDACLATGIPLRRLAALCMLGSGAPLAPQEAMRWAALLGVAR